MPSIAPVVGLPHCAASACACAVRLPRLDRAGVFIDDEVVPAFRYLRHDVTDRVRVAKALTGLGRRDAAVWAGRSADEWLDHVTDDAAGRALLASAVRTATYSADLARTDASAVASQLRLASHGVLYLHHGWSTLVDGLADVVRSAGGQLRTRSTVAAVEHDDEGVHAVRLADGHGLDADAVIVAVNEPRRVAGLLQGAPAARLRAIADDTVPVRMAHLDVALRPLPEPRFPNVLGLDVPVYLTIQSSVADVAPRMARCCTSLGTSVRARRVMTIDRSSSTPSTSCSRTGRITSSMPASCPGRW